MEGVMISRESAYLLSRLLDELIEIDRRAACSDRYFRQHFMSVVKAGIAGGTFEELREQLRR